MGVTRGHNKADRRSAGVITLNFAAILAEASSQNLRLQRNLAFSGDIDKEIAQLAVGDHRVFIEKDRGALSKSFLGLLGNDVRNIACNADFQSDSDVWLDGLHRRMRPAFTDFLLCCP